MSVNFAVADVDGFASPEAAYDGVAAEFVQFADPDMRARLSERMVRCLKPGGVLVLQGYPQKQLDYRIGGSPILSHLHTRDLLELAFSGLSIIDLREYEAEVREGQGHSGQSALIGLVALMGWRAWVSPASCDILSLVAFSLPLSRTLGTLGQSANRPGYFNIRPTP